MLIFLLNLCLSLKLNFIPSTKTPPSSRYSSYLGHLKSRSSLILFGGKLGSSLYNDIWEFSLISMTWQEIIPLSSEKPGIFHLAPRKNSGGLTSNSKPKFYIFSGETSLGPENDFWEFDFDHLKWNQKQTLNTPSPRFGFGFTSFLEGNHEMLAIQGGNNLDLMVYEMWMYVIFRLNLSSLEWTLMEDDGEHPLPGIYSVLLYYEESLIQTAGKSENQLCLPYLYRYSLTDRKWEVISDKKSSIKCRYLCQAFIHNNKLFVLYGLIVENFETVKNILIFDFKDKSKTWQELKLFPEIASSEYSLIKVENSVFHFGGHLFSLQESTNILSKINLNTLEVKKIHDFLIFPNQRAWHSMVLINQKIFLFGGINNDQIFNDLWTFDIHSLVWSQISAKGFIPSPRYLHAAGAEGNIFMIWGGKDKTGLKDDLFIFNSLTLTWTELFSTSTKPRPAKGACLVMKDFKMYLYGGRTDSDTSNELWQYQLGNESYELISQSFNYYVKDPYCWVDSQVFYAALGSFKNECPSVQIKAFNFSSSKWTDYHHHAFTMWDSGHSVRVFVDKKLISIGGWAWNEFRIMNISVIGPGSELKQFELGQNQAIIGSASVYYKKKIFVFGGVIENGKIILTTHGHNLLYFIELEEICEKGDCKALCSTGTYGKDCRSCPPGTYNDVAGSSDCIECKVGRFNQNKSSSSPQQCLPCPEGTYNNLTGASICQVCPDEKHCPIGSTVILEPKKSHTTGSIQPPLYKDPDLTESMLIFRILVSVPLFLIMVVLFSFGKLRKFAKKLDIFDDKHDNPDSEFMIKKKTLVGTCFSFLFVIGAFLLTCASILEYFKSNIHETKGLVTLVVLESEAEVFEAESFLVQVTLHSYGGKCELKLFDTIEITSKNINYTEQLVTSQKLENNLCRIKISCKNVIIKTGAQYSIHLDENPSYSSDIEVNLTSSSSIPNRVSSVFSLIEPAKNSVFIGSIPSEFYFLVTPSLFKSESNRWEKDETGYHISEQSSPKAGSMYEFQDLSSVSSLNLKISIEKSSTGLLTQRKLKQNFLIFFGSLLGTFSGFFGIAGFVMTLFEAQVDKVLKRKKFNDKNSIIAAGTDINSTKIEKNEQKSENANFD